jgi:hypothetical protein
MYATGLRSATGRQPRRHTRRARFSFPEKAGRGHRPRRAGSVPFRPADILRGASPPLPQPTPPRGDPSGQRLLSASAAAPASRSTVSRHVSLSHLTCARRHHRMLCLPPSLPLPAFVRPEQRPGTSGAWENRMPRPASPKLQRAGT